MNQKNGIKRRQLEIYTEMIGMIAILAVGQVLNLNGITYTIVAFECWELFWCLVGSNVSDTLARMVKTRYNKGQYRNACAVQHHVTLTHGIVSAFVSLILAVCAEPIATYLFHVPYATFILIAFAPALFLRTLNATLEGVFQGEGSELQTVVAGLIRQLLFFVLAFVGADLFAGYGEKVSKLLKQDAFLAMYSGLGVACGMVLTELVLFIFLLVTRWQKPGRKKSKDMEGLKATDSAGSIIGIFYGNLWQHSCIHMLEWLPLCVGALIFLSGAGEEKTLAIHYGVFAGKFLPLVGLVFLPVAAMLLSVAVRIVSGLRRDEERLAKNHFQSGLHLGVIHGLFFSIFLAVTANPLATFFCSSQPQLLIDLLRFGSSLVLGLSLLYFFIKVLYFMGKRMLVLGALAGVNVIYAVCVIFFMRGDTSSVIALVYAGIVTLFAACVALGAYLFRLLHVSVNALAALGIPVGAACISGLLQVLIVKVCAPHLGSLLTIVLTLLVSGIVYWVILLLSKNVKEPELKTSTFGQLIYYFGHMVNLV